MTTRPSLALAALTGALLLAGCGGKAARGDRAAATAQHRAAATHAAPASAVPPQHPALAPLPDRTGIALCDAYLASYKGCHRAAGIYPTDQLEARYQAMRTSLLRDAQNPDIRPQLASRCNALATQLRRALHGKPCETGPAAAGSSGSR
ncbi:hypothetical protein [Frateuria defendens]|uniref:hypothetical protein n=1 Tax=Frateuria defendens TaxID=2219559 RepID=UPI00066FCC2C|nr:hypothetical protein [Frateuria defendens]